MQSLRSKWEEVKLENSVLNEQIADQNKLIERLENGLNLAMDQVDYLTQQLSPAQNTSKSLPSTLEDDVNYNDLDETTLLQLISQTKEALLEKRNGLLDPYDDLDY